MKVGNLAHELDRVYEYFQHLLIKANIRKDAAPIDECIQLMASVRDTWQEAFDNLGQAETSASPKINQHGSAVMDIQG